MPTTTLYCNWCNSPFEKENKEITRQRKQGRNDFYCSLSCGGYANNDRNPHLGEMGRERFIQLNRENNGDPWKQHQAHLASQQWKYRSIQGLLDSLGINYIFEYPITSSNGRLYLFDLYLPPLGLLVEFDGKHHCGLQNGYDLDKDQSAFEVGLTVARVPVQQSSVYSPEAVLNLLPVSYIGVG